MALTGANALAITVLIWSFGPGIYSLCLDELFFEADTASKLVNLTDRHTHVHSTVRHPIWILLEYPPVALVTSLFDLPEIWGIWLVGAATAGLWLATYYALIRSLGVARGDAAVFAALAGSSSAAIFWFAVPETFQLGAITLMLPIWLVARGSSRASSYAVATAFGLGVSVTNVMAGVVATVVRFPRHMAISILLLAYTIVGLLFVVERLTFPSANVPMTLKPALSGAKYINDPRAGSPLMKIRSMVFHGMIAPEVEVLETGIRSFQRSPLGSSGSLGVVGTGLWTGLLVLGGVSLVTAGTSWAPRLVFAAILLGQLGFHTLFGDETFLFSLHITTLLAILAAFATLSRWRPIALSLALVLIPLAVVNNVRQFQSALGPGRAGAAEIRARQEYAPIRDSLAKPIHPILAEVIRGGPPVVLESRKSLRWMLVLPLIFSAGLASIFSWQFPRLRRKQ